MYNIIKKIKNKQMKFTFLAAILSLTGAIKLVTKQSDEEIAERTAMFNDVLDANGDGFL